MQLGVLNGVITQSYPKTTAVGEELWEWCQANSSGTRLIRMSSCVL